MKIKSLLIGLVLALSSVTATAASPLETNKVTNEEWRFICDNLLELGYQAKTCKRMDRPIVIVSKVVRDMARPGEILYGFTYDDEPYIFISHTAPHKRQRTIVVHESVHYVLRAIYGPAMRECLSEEVARVIHHKWEGTPYDDTWRIHYGCPFGL